MIKPKEPWKRFYDSDEKLEFMKRLGLAATGDTFPKTLTYSGGYVKEPTDCILLGYVRESTLVIQIAGEEHCINSDCLLDMQAGMRSASAPEEYVVLDVETTGFNHKVDDIIEIAAVRYKNGTECGAFSSLVNPGRPIPFDVVDLTGITDEDVKDAPEFKDILPDLVALLEDLPIVAHNASFDISFLSDAFSAAGLRLRNKSIDTVTLARKSFPGLPSYTLEHLKVSLQLADQPSHRALSDVYTTAELFSYCNNELRRSQFAKDREENNTADNTKGSVDSESQKPPRKGAKRFQSQPKPSEITCTVDQIDASCPLCGKQLVFTGELSMSRAEAMQIAVNSGAVVKTSVSRKTDYLVVGKQDLTLVGDDGRSTKEEKAYALNADGKAVIQIIDEAEFLRLSKERKVADE